MMTMSSNKTEIACVQIYLWTVWILVFRATTDDDEDEEEEER